MQIMYIIKECLASSDEHWQEVLSKNIISSFSPDTRTEP